jgi:hypothetical protein
MTVTRLVASIILACACAAIVTAQAPQAQPTPKPIKKQGYFSRARFETSYDKFKDETTVKFKRLPLTGGMRLAMSAEMIYLMGAFQFKGQKMSEPATTAYLGFLSESKDWVFLRDQHLIVLVDGERIDLGDAERDSDIRIGEVKELLVFDVPAETLSKIANGDKVEMQLGSREFKLKDNARAALRDLAERMRPE